MGVESDDPRNTCARCTPLDVDDVLEPSYVMKTKHIHDRESMFHGTDCISLDGELSWPQNKSLTYAYTTHAQVQCYDCWGWFEIERLRACANRCGARLCHPCENGCPYCHVGPFCARCLHAGWHGCT